MTDWAFADCSNTPFPGTPDAGKICVKGGFDPAWQYELVYRAKDPLVLGIGRLTPAAPADERDPQIAALEKQIAELQAKLEALKGRELLPTPSNPVSVIFGNSAARAAPMLALALRS